MGTHNSGHNTKSLTPTQEETLSEIKKFCSEHGVSPTIREIAGIFGITISSAHERVSNLIKKGYLAWRSDLGGSKARSLIVQEKRSDESNGGKL